MTSNQKMLLGAGLGGWVGGAIGFFGAPPWEMAVLFVGPASSFAGTVAGVLGARSLFAGIGSLLLSGLFAAAMGWLASSNPAWVIERSAGSVFVAGALGAVVGYLIGRSTPRLTA